MSKYIAKVFAASGDAIRGFAIQNSSIHSEVTEAASYQPCDIAVVYGAVREKSRASDRIAVRNNIFSAHKGPLIVVETGFVGRTFPKRSFSRLKSVLGIYQRNKSESPYFRIGLGGAFGDDADFCNSNSPSDRWNRLKEEFGLSIKPYRTAGSHILLVGQVPNDASLKGADINKWLVETCRDIRTYTDRPIKVRLHPRTVKEEAIPIMRAIKGVGATLADPVEPISSDLQKCWACVTFSSSSCVEALLAGVPPICASPASIAYAVSSNSISEVENPKLMDDREGWFSDLAYAQWNATEMASGLAWSHLEKRVLTILADEV